MALLKIINQIQSIKIENKNKVEAPAAKTKFANGTYNKKAKITASALNVRAGRPGDPKYGTIYGTYKKGQVVTVKYCLNNWFGVIYNGKQCFISGDYVELL